MDKGFIVINPATMGEAQFENLLIFLEKLTNEKIKNPPEAG